MIQFLTILFFICCRSNFNKNTIFNNIILSFVADIIAKKKWKHLRYSFRSGKKGKPKSGDAQDSCKTQWKWVKNVEFLKGCLS